VTEVSMETTEAGSVEREERFMRMALDEAAGALDEGEVPVGCVLVLRDEVLARGRNKTNVTRNGTRHCEMEAIDEAIAKHGGNASAIPWQEVELFVTCEPCIMCAGALCLMGIKTVHYGCDNDKFGGCGSVFHISSMGCGTCGSGAGPQNNVGFECHKGLFASEAITLLQDFYLKGNSRGWYPETNFVCVTPDFRSLQIH